MLAKPEPLRADEHVVAHDGLALHLHGVIRAAAAEIALDDVHRLPGGAIDGDAGILRVVNVVFGDEIAPRALLDLDAIALIPAAVVDVIQGDHALAHDVLAVVRAEIHALAVAAAVVDVIARQEQAAGVGAVRAQADLAGVVDVALVDPHLAAMAEPQAVAAARDLHAAQAKILHGSALADVEHVLLRIRPGEDNLGALLRHDPDGSLRRAADADVPQAIDAVGAGGDDELIARLKRGDRFDEGFAIRLSCLITRFGVMSAQSGA